MNKVAGNVLAFLIVADEFHVFVLGQEARRRQIVLDDKLALHVTVFPGTCVLQQVKLVLPVSTVESL